MYFYDDPEMSFGQVGEEFIAMWRSIGVESVGEKGVEDYLIKNGLPCVRTLSSAGEMGAGQGGRVDERKKYKKRGRAAKITNVHLDGVLREYEME